MILHEIVPELGLCSPDSVCAPSEHTETPKGPLQRQPRGRDSGVAAKPRIHRPGIPHPSPPSHCQSKQAARQRIAPICLCCKAPLHNLISLLKAPRVAVPGCKEAQLCHRDRAQRSFSIAEWKLPE